MQEGIPFGISPIVPYAALILRAHDVSSLSLFGHIWILAGISNGDIGPAHRPLCLAFLTTPSRETGLSEAGDRFKPQSDNKTTQELP
jgi:hypothetical protein